MRYGFKSWSEKQAFQWRFELGLERFQPLKAEQLAEYFVDYIFKPSEIPDLDEATIEQLVGIDYTSWSAATILIPRVNHIAIIYNPNHSPARHESNLMHELSHLICEHVPVTLTKVDGLDFPVREYRKEDEKEAAWLGGCLQIPRDGLAWAVKRKMNNQQIAQHFGASIKMVEYRRNVTGIDKHFQRYKRKYQKRRQ